MGGIPTAIALLASGPDRRIVRDALAVLVAVLCKEGAELTRTGGPRQAVSYADYRPTGWQLAGRLTNQMSDCPTMLLMDGLTDVWQRLLRPCQLSAGF